MFGRKLDMVCSMQPYGKRRQVVERAEDSDPAIDGDTRIASDREPGSHLRGKRQLECGRRVPAADRSAVRLRTASRRGCSPAASSSSASDSSLVSALPVQHRAARPAAPAPANRPSPRPRLRNLHVSRRAVDNIQTLHVERHARRLFRPSDSCAPAPKSPPRRPARRSAAPPDAGSDSCARWSSRSRRPTLVSGVTPRAVARQVVSESGNSTLRLGVPARVGHAGPPPRTPCPGNALRTFGWTSRSGLSCASRDGGRSSASCMRRLPASPLK